MLLDLSSYLTTFERSASPYVIVVDLALQSPKQVQNGGKDTAFILHVQIYFCAFFDYLYKVKFLFFCFYMPVDT